MILPSDIAERLRKIGEFGIEANGPRGPANGSTTSKAEPTTPHETAPPNDSPHSDDPGDTGTTFNQANCEDVPDDDDGRRRDPAIDRAFVKLTEALQAADNDLAKMQAIRECAEALEPLGDDEAIRELIEMGPACGISADNIEAMEGIVEQGLDRARRKRAAQGQAGPRKSPNQDDHAVAIVPTPYRYRPASKGRSSSSIGRSGGEEAEGITVDDFFAYLPQHRYIFAPIGEMWPASSVNARFGRVKGAASSVNARLGLDDGIDENGDHTGMSASAWLDQNKSVEQMTWAPGMPMLIRDRLVAEGGWIERHGVAVFNLYRPPVIQHGDAGQAGPWKEHAQTVFGEDAEHIIWWLAHRVQRPEEKINHALLLGGDQGIGKDTLLEPVKHAIGPWNFIEVSPQQMLGRFNGFLKSVILRLSEARDLGDVDRFKFYDHMKVITAAPPDVLRVDEKNLREHSIVNVTGAIITTNHKSDGIYLPADDRRHFVAWSDKSKEDFTPEYWRKLWAWYEAGGYGHVAAYLATLDLSNFDPKAPPPKTPAFWDIVDAGRAPEDAELADVLDRLGNPAAVTIGRIAIEATGDFHEWILDRKNRRNIPHRMERCGYVRHRNDGAEDGLFKINGTRQAIYVKDGLPTKERFLAANGLMGAPGQ